MRPNGRCPVTVFGLSSCAFPSHRHVEDLLQSFEAVAFEVKGDLPFLLQKGNGSQEIVSCYLVFCFAIISRLPWTYKYCNITSTFYPEFQKSVSYPSQCSHWFPSQTGPALAPPPDWEEWREKQGARGWGGTKSCWCQGKRTRLVQQKLPVSKAFENRLRAGGAPSLRSTFCTSVKL